MQFGRFVFRSVRLSASGAGRRQEQRRGLRLRSSSEAVGGAQGGLGQQASGWGKWLMLAGSAPLLGSVALAFQQKQDALEPFPHKHYEASKSTHPWIQQLEEDENTSLVLTAEALLQSDHPFLEDDHMFSAFVDKGIVDDLHGFYNPKTQTFSTVISLGREVCGFPRVVHGGLTAAIIDESFGGLLFALKQQKALNFWGPAYTVALEVQYKSKIAAGSTVLCTTEVESVEGRKLWMKATVSDGPDGKVFATARALFVAPKPDRLVKDVAQYLFRRVFPRD